MTPLRQVCLSPTGTRLAPSNNIDRFRVARLHDHQRDLRQIATRVIEHPITGILPVLR